MKIAVKWRTVEEFERVIDVPDNVDVAEYVDAIDVDEFAMEGPNDGTYVATPDRYIVDWEVHPEPLETLVTIEVSEPGKRYALLDHDGGLSVHLAPQTARGTGKILCGFDRFAPSVGFSVGGGFTSPNENHRVCRECAALIGGRVVRGTHCALVLGVCAGMDSAE